MAVALGGIQGPPGILIQNLHSATHELEMALIWKTERIPSSLITSSITYRESWVGWLRRNTDDDQFVKVF
jgi:hypothetical protein